MPDQAPRWATPREAAGYAHHDTETIRRWIRSGKLAATRTPAGRLLINLDDLAAVLQPVHPPPRQQTAPVTCPSCGTRFTGVWVSIRRTAAQRCPHCRASWDEQWPGLGPLAPDRRVMTVPPDGAA